MQIHVVKKILIILLYLYGGFVYSADIVYQIPIQGAIGPATSQYVSKGIEIANSKGAKLIVLFVDTPGGLDISMRDIIQDILNSNVPIVGYVHPSGARAASAGTYILYASHLAAMSPGTNLGAASPVSISPLSDIEDTNNKKQNRENTLMQKVKNDSKAYIRSLAELRNRNVTWAEKSVTESDSISAEIALKRKVIDFITENDKSLVEKANGRVVNIKGKAHKIEIKNPVYEKFVIDIKTQFLLTITDPSIAYMLFLAGIYGLFFEFTNPGLIVPGVLGGIALIVSLYGMNSLPISYAGLGLLFLGVMLIISELYVTSYGILGTGGLISLVLGSIFLYDSNAYAFQLGYSVILSVAVVNLAILIGIVYFAIASHRRKKFLGLDSMISTSGVALSDSQNSRCSVMINGEIWDAKTTHQIYKDQKIEVIGMDGLLLTIKSKKTKE